jgi:hypothetical protein
VYRRARPVEDRTTEVAGYALRIAVLVLGLLGATVLTRGIQLRQAGPDRLPAAAV